MKPRLAGALAALLAAAGARAEGGGAGAGFTAGSGGYREARARAWFDLSPEFWLAPRLAFYRSDELASTRRLFGLGAGYEPDRWRFAGDLALEPRVDGYSRASLGLDAGRVAPLEGETELEAGAGLGFTRHSDEFAAAPRGRGRGAARSDDLVVRQADLSVYAAARGEAASLRVRAAKSVYDRDLAAVAARRPPGSGAFGAAVGGFPDSRLTATARLLATRPVEPFVTVERTAFELGDPPGTGYEAGVAVTVAKGVEVTASLELYRQAGSADRRFVSAGASAKF